MDKNKRLLDALEDVEFEYIDHVQEAAKKIQDIPGQEVIDWISKRLTEEWNSAKVINGRGMQNLEKVFGAKFSTETLINSYFTEDERWYHPNSQMLKEFAKLTGRRITTNDIIRNLDIEYLIGGYGPGLNVFIDFIKDNNGDIKILVKRIAEAIEDNKISHKGAEEIIFFLAPYIKTGEINTDKLFRCVNWHEAEKDPYTNIIVEFFNSFAPELVSQIPF